MYRIFAINSDKATAQCSGRRKVFLLSDRKAEEAGRKAEEECKRAGEAEEKLRPVEEKLKSLSETMSLN